MGLFSFKKKAIKEKHLTIYLAEDNPVYLKQLEFFLKNRFEHSISVSAFPVSEVIDVKLEHGHIPDVIIMDHVLSEKYEDASAGLDAIQTIHERYPNILLILHSADVDAGSSDSRVYKNVPKGEGALEHIAELIKQRLNN